MAGLWKADLLVVTFMCLLELGSFGGYSCNCDCGPNAGGGRCSLVLPSLHYLDSPGECQAIQLDKVRQYCTKNTDTEDETVCWSMPRIACMCKEPTGSYNLMCECDGNQGIFCGSEQNNCVCEVLVEDPNIAITIGIAVGASVIGIFVLTFIITIIYFIRKAQKEKDPWYQFDKQFKKFMAIKEREKRMGTRPQQRKAARPYPHPSSKPTPSKPTNTSLQVDATIETQQQQPLLATLDQTKRSPAEDQNRQTSQTAGANWLLATKEDGGILEENIGTGNASVPAKSTENLSNLYSSPSKPKDSVAPSTRGDSNIYASALTKPDQTSNVKSSYHLHSKDSIRKFSKDAKSLPTKSTQNDSSTLKPSSTQPSAIVQHAAHINHGYDHDTIYETLH